MSALDDESAAALLFGDGPDDRFGAVGPELVAAVVPFLAGDRLRLACDTALRALLTRSRERQPGTDLLRSADKVARALADQGGVASQSHTVEEFFLTQRQPLAKPIWQAATDLARTVSQWIEVDTLALAPWRSDDLLAAARSAKGAKKVPLYAALVGWTEPALEVVLEVAARAHNLFADESAVLLAWCSAATPAGDAAAPLQEATLAAVREALGRGRGGIELVAAVGLTEPRLAGRLAKETSDLAATVPPQIRDVGLVAEWLERALPAPPPERLRWNELQDQLPQLLETVDEATRAQLLATFLRRMTERWGTIIGGGMLHEPAPEESGPFAEQSPPFPEQPAAPAAQPAPPPAASHEVLPNQPTARPCQPAPPRPRRGASGGVGSRLTDAVSGLLRRRTTVGEGAEREDPERPPAPELQYFNSFGKPPVLELPERVLNLAVTDIRHRPLATSQTLTPATGYLVRIDIGALAAESAVVNPTPIPTELLEPSSTEGFWFDVVVASADVEVAAELHRLFLPFFGSSFVCPCSGSEHVCTEQERQLFLYVGIRTRQRIGQQMVRCIVYDRNNVVQTARIQLTVAGGEPQPEAIHAVIDYTLAASFEDAQQLPDRRVNILTNETGDGTHKIVVKDANRAIAVDLTEQQARDVLVELRAKLKEITIGADGQTSQYDDQNRKDEQAFVSDLTQLAALGSLLWGAVVPGRDDRAYLREQLAARTTIQIARVTKVVFPWALVYDIPHELAAGWTLCPLLADWAAERDQLSAYPDKCPHADAHHANVLCPYGFWGFRHLIEQPAKVRQGVLRTRIRVTEPAQAAFARSLQLNQVLTAAHLAELTACFESRFQLADCQSRLDLQTAFADPALPILYFYCHGKSGLVAGTRLEVPFLEIGAGEMIGTNDFAAWDEDGNWGPAHWSDVAPLVFINGCQTTALSPEDIASFVDALAGMNAAGVIGTEIPVTQQLAGEVATRFYRLFAGASNETVGTSLYRTRINLLQKGNIGGLVYTPFCSMDLALEVASQHSTK